MISSQATYRDVQQELISEIQRTSLWPVVVTVDGNISVPDETDFIDRDGNYIILIPDGNISTFEEEFLDLAKDGTKWTRFWNSESRFVVAGANEFSMSQQTEIFDFLSKLRIYNCIIVNREHYLIDKEHSSPLNVNDVDTGMKLGVYTWFPYQSSDRCSEVNDITLLDSWIISAQGHFTKNTDFFPRKFSNNFNGCPMTAFVRINGWNFTTYHTEQRYLNGSVVRHVKGLEMDLLRLVLKEMNMTFIRVPFPFGFRKYKGFMNNSIWHMFAKKAYIALGCVAKPFSFHPLVDLTNSYCLTSVRWYVPCSFKNPRWSSFFRILSGELWLVLIISLVIAAISATLVGRYSCTSEWQVYKSLKSSLTNFWAVTVGVAVSTVPRTPSLRLLFLAWVCFSVAFSTVFQAFLTTFLVDSGYKTPIQSMDELYASGTELVYHLSDHYYFQNGNGTDVERSPKCFSWSKCVSSAIHHKNASVLMDDLDAKGKYAEGSMLDENSEPTLCRLEDGVVYNDGLRMFMFHGDPLMKRVNEIIDRVVEAGIYNYWISLTMHSFKLSSRKIAIFQPLDAYYSFNLFHMQPAFYLLLMGWFLSALCFMFELLCSRLLSIRVLKLIMGRLLH